MELMRLDAIAGRVVVGVDGSSYAAAAAMWALAWAREAGTGLTVLVAYGSGVAPHGPASLSRHVFETLRDASAGRLEDTVDQLRARDPEADIDGYLVHGGAAEHLVEAAQAADLVVIGTQGAGAGRLALLGGVADQIVTHARGTVVVVPSVPPRSLAAGREPTAPTIPLLTGPIVLGVDGTAASTGAVGFAFETASRTGVPIIALGCWEMDPVVGVIPVDEAIATERRTVEAAIAPYVARYPHVPVERRVLQEHPAVALLAAAGEAGMLVVGSRGRGGFTGLLLGSTSRKIIQQSPVPVAVVRRH